MRKTQMPIRRRCEFMLTAKLCVDIRKLPATALLRYRFAPNQAVLRYSSASNPELHWGA
jgi:hypothetical protein